MLDFETLGNGVLDGMSASARFLLCSISFQGRIPLAIGSGDGRL
jgi:hypothetical protein